MGQPEKTDFFSTGWKACATEFLAAKRFSPPRAAALHFCVDFYFPALD
jgi:hypothetical protein